MHVFNQFLLKICRAKLRKVTGVDVPVHDPLQSQRDVNQLEAAPSKQQSRKPFLKSLF